MRKALAAPFSGKGLLRWLLGAILSIIPLISLFADGYRYRLIQNGISGDITTPKWNDWGGLFVKGFLFFLVSFIYMLVPLVISIVFFVITGLTDISSALIAALLIVNLLLYAVFGFFLPMGWAHFAATGSFTAAFNFESIFKSIKIVFPQYLGALLLFVALWVTVSVFSFIPLVGWLFAVLMAFYAYIVSGLLFGEVYRRSQAISV